MDSYFCGGKQSPGETCMANPWSRAWTPCPTFWCKQWHWPWSPAGRSGAKWHLSWLMTCRNITNDAILVWISVGSSIILPVLIWSYFHQKRTQPSSWILGIFEHPKDPSIYKSQYPRIPYSFSKIFIWIIQFSNVILDKNCPLFIMLSCTWYLCAPHIW